MEWVRYDGVSVGVPFVWELKPGTPKHGLASSASFSDASNYLARPLTPPPSALYHRAHHKPAKRRAKSFAFRSLLTKLSAALKRAPDRVGLEAESEAPAPARSSSAAEDSSAYSLMRMFRRSLAVRSIQ